MEHEIVADDGGLVQSVAVQPGQTVQEGELLATLEPAQTSHAAPQNAEQAPETRDDLRAVEARHALTRDQARPEAVQKRHDQGRRTARENLEDLIDENTLVEYGPLMFAAQERRRDKDELIRRTPADGLVAGTADIESQPAVVMSYDYTVLAGTQGMRNHTKKDRLLRDRRRPPPAAGGPLFAAEGGGGRPGDVDWPHVAGLDLPGLSPSSPGSAAWFLWSVSALATASPATRPCSAAATW